jgi:hypothetical protein
MSISIFNGRKSDEAQAVGMVLAGTYNNYITCGVTRRPMSDHNHNHNHNYSEKKEESDTQVNRRFNVLLFFIY